MIDKEQVQHMTDVAGECNRLNEISQPLGYAVTATTTVDDQSMQQFMIHRLDPDRRQRPQVRNYRGGSCSPRGNREATTLVDWIS